MNMIDLAERGFLPDWLLRFGIRRLLKSRLRQETRANRIEPNLTGGPIAVATDKANEQHYELPAEFFETVLGPRLKYSCCLFDDRGVTLQAAEEAMLRLTCERAQIEDGMDILDLGCGWGSLSLWIAEKYPRCTVTAVSNSNEQRHFIENRCRSRKLSGVRVITRDAKDDWNPGVYDRVVSVEMFEHVRNHESLLRRIAAWLRPEGKLFVHIFCHRDLSYTFEDDGRSDWMARHFFTGGMMPAYNLLRTYDVDLCVCEQWEVDGRHYAQTCENWLRRLDDNRDRLLRLFKRGQGSRAAKIALQRWRMFFMACAELFGCHNGAEWFVGHYLFEPVTQSSQGDARSLLANEGRTR